MHNIFYIAILSLHFVANPQTTILLANESLILTCSATGSPSPTITWLVDGREVKGDEYSINSAKKGNTTISTITVMPAKFKHTGNYSCLTNNICGNYFLESNKATVIILLGM